MTKTKKTVWVAVILVSVMVLTGFGFAVNSGACGFNSFHRHGFSRSGMPHFMQEEVKSFIIWRMDNGVKELGLSGSQKEQYDIFREQFLDTMEKAMAARAEFRNKVISSLESENPDLSLMATEAKSHVEILSAAVSENLARFAEFFNSLETSQRKIITDKIKERMDEKGI